MSSRASYSARSVARAVMVGVAVLSLIVVALLVTTVVQLEPKTAVHRLAWLLAVTVLAVLAAVLVGGIAFRRSVLRPLAQLGEQSRVVADGQLGQSVSATGPREVIEVGEDVEAMRRHLLDELDASRRASEALTQGEPAVQALLEALRHSPVVHASGLEIAAQIESAEGVLAGDFVDIVDIVELGSGLVAVVLGDVSGHGPQAAVVGLRLKIALSTVLYQAALDDLLDVLRSGLASEPELFATVFVAIIDAEGGSITYVNAGHPPPLLISEGETVELAPTGPLVSAVLSESTWEVEVAAFAPGDLLVSFSDGVPEARAADGSEFGVEGVRSELAELTAPTADDVVQRLRTAVRDFADGQRDDVSILVARRV